MAQRVKGQEVEVVMLQDGLPQDNLTFARSLELIFKTDILEEGYLGETTNRFDTVFKGVRGRVEFHFDNPVVFQLIVAIVDKARRRIPGTRFNMKAVLNFPSGRRARTVIRDVEFGELPVKFGGRTDYGTFNMDFAASEAQLLPL